LLDFVDEPLDQIAWVAATASTVCSGDRCGASDPPLPRETSTANNTTPSRCGSLNGFPNQPRRNSPACNTAKDAAQARRLLAIASVLDGASRGEAAKVGGIDRQMLRDWVIRFNDQGPDGLINFPSPGVPPEFDATHRRFSPGSGSL
jgi:hypothetical protein